MTGNICPPCTKGTPIKLKLHANNKLEIKEYKNTTFKLPSHKLPLLVMLVEELVKLENGIKSMPMKNRVPIAPTKLRLPSI